MCPTARPTRSDPSSLFPVPETDVIENVAGPRPVAGTPQTSGVVNVGGKKGGGKLGLCYVVTGKLYFDILVT